MKLDRRRGTACCERTLERGGHSRSFGRSGREHEEGFGIQNRSDSHRDGHDRRLEVWLPELIVPNCGARESLDSSARPEARAGFVETNVSVPTDAQDLEVDPATGFDQRFVSRRLGSRVCRVSGGDVSVDRIYIYVSEEAVVHGAVEGPRVLRANAEVFVKVERLGAGKAQMAQLVSPDQFSVESLGGGPSRQTKTSIGFPLDQLSADVCSLHGNGFGRLENPHVHVRVFPPPNGSALS